MRCLLLFLFLTQLSTINYQPLHAAVFTTNALITETDASYDGQDIEVNGATLTVDGRHYFNSVLLTNGAALTHSLCTTTNPCQLRPSNEN